VAALYTKQLAWRHRNNAYLAVYGGETWRESKARSIIIGIMASVWQAP